MGKAEEVHLDGADFVIIDVETTGLSAENGDRVCELGAVKMRGGAVVDTLGTLIDPRRPISAGAYAVNKISPGMLVDAPRFEAIVPRLSGMITGSVLVAYNAPFDLSFIQSEFRLAGHPAIRNPVVDALGMARQLLPGLARYPQSAVARAVGISSPVRHRALEDAMVTAQIFTLFSSMLKTHDCIRCADLQRKDLAPVLHAKRADIVQQALRSTCDLRMRYFAADAIADHLVTPERYVDGASAGTSHLVGYSHTSQGVITFRIDRILDLFPVAREGAR